MKRLVVSLCTLLCCCGAVREAEALRMSVLFPSESGRVLAPTRDFTVVCSLDREGKTPEEQPFNVRFELYREGNPSPVRTVTSAVDASGLTPAAAILTEYENGRTPYTTADILAAPLPDLVYDPTRPGSIYDPAIRAVVQETYCAAVIQGGRTKDFDSTYALAYTTDLEEGNYTLTLSAVGNAGVPLASVSIPLVFGSVPDKILARFSPKSHMDKVTAFAAAEGSHLYLDPFPGYWSASDLPGGGSLFYEIVRRWRPNDTLEYLSGKVRAILYNIHATSTSQVVEIGGMAHALRLRAPSLLCHHYDIGDPAVSYDVGDGTVAIRQGTIVPFNTDDRLVLTRAEIRGNGISNVPAADYVCSPDLADKQVDWNVADGVEAKPGQLVSLFGVVVPIQPALSDVVVSSDGTYTVNNRIDTVRYALFEEGQEVVSFDRMVELTRFGVDNRPSLYEFRHDIPLSGDIDARTITVRLSAFDSHGNAVGGTEEEFLLTVRSSGGGGNSGGGGCNTGAMPFALPLLLPGAFLLRRGRGKRVRTPYPKG